jgi:uncharacterized protein (DUF2164 family)
MAIELNKEDTRNIIPSMQRYMREEFDLEIGDMQAGFMLKFILAEIAPFAYNKGVSDAERFFSEKVADLSGTCYEPGMTYWTKKKK